MRAFARTHPSALAAAHARSSDPARTGPCLRSAFGLNAPLMAAPSASTPPWSPSWHAPLGSLCSASPRDRPVPTPLIGSTPARHHLKPPPFRASFTASPAPPLRHLLMTPQLGHPLGPPLRASSLLCGTTSSTPRGRTTPLRACATGPHCSQLRRLYTASSSTCTYPRSPDDSPVWPPFAALSPP